jgi:plastocyanin
VSWLAALVAAGVAAAGVVAPAPDHNTSVGHRTLPRCTRHRHHHCVKHRVRPVRQRAPQRPAPARPKPAPAASSPVPGAVPIVPGATATPTPAPLPRRTSVRLDDTSEPWTLAPERDTLGTGQITFTAYNRGMDDHNLSVDSPSRTVHYGSVDLPANDTDDPPELTVDLPAGRYVLFCDLPGHEQAGMISTITVQ